MNNYCRNCGQKLEMNAEICSNCNTKVLMTRLNIDNKNNITNENEYNNRDKFYVRLIIIALILSFVIPYIFIDLGSGFNYNVKTFLWDFLGPVLSGICSIISIILTIYARIVFKNSKRVRILFIFVFITRILPITYLVIELISNKLFN